MRIQTWSLRLRGDGCGVGGRRGKDCLGGRGSEPPIEEAETDMLLVAHAAMHCPEQIMGNDCNCARNVWRRSSGTKFASALGFKVSLRRFKYDSCGAPNWMTWCRVQLLWWKTCVQNIRHFQPWTLLALRCEGSSRCRVGMDASSFAFIFYSASFAVKC